MDIETQLKAIRTHEQAHEFANLVIPAQTPMDDLAKRMLSRAITEELAESNGCDELQVELRLIDMEIQMIEYRDMVTELQPILSHWRSHNGDFTIHSCGECQQWARAIITADWCKDKVRVGAWVIEHCAALVIKKQGVCTSAQLALAMAKEKTLFEALGAGARIAGYIMRDKEGWKQNKLTH